MTKELTTTEAKELEAFNAEMAAAFGTSQVSSSDIIIPKMMVMQGLSQLVMDGKAKFGDFVDNTTDEIIGDMTKDFEVIPFHMEKLWYISVKKGGDYEFSKVEAVTAVNENAPYEEILDGEPIKRQMVRNFYCLRPSDMAIPMVISFKGMSTKAGKQLATQMYLKNVSEGKQPPAYHINITGEKSKNDKGTFVTLKVAKGKPSTMQEMMECIKWYKTINSGKAKVQEEAPTSNAANNSQF